MNATRKTACRECGTTFERGRMDREFCGNACRMRFNGRRNARGAILYDLFMAQRFEREAATDAGVWSRMCAVAANFRAEDERGRAGRRSWQTIGVTKAKTVGASAKYGRI